MAPKKELASLGSAQPVGDGWRAEVSNLSKGPKRATHAEAAEDLRRVQQASTREEMKTLLAELREEARSAQPLAGPHEEAEVEVPPRRDVAQPPAAENTEVGGEASTTKRARTQQNGEAA